MDASRIIKILDKISMPDEEAPGNYKGAEVTLNKPFVSDDKERLFAVYSKNQYGDVVLTRFMDRNNTDQIDDKDYVQRTMENYKCDIQKDMSTPSFWMCRVISNDKFSFADKAMDHKFEHQVFFDLANKTVKSVRDGVQEYFGAELGLEPYDRKFTVYRAPETITSLVGMMDKLPIIEDHIDPELKPSPETVVGLIDDTEVVEYTEDFKDSTLFLRNKTAINEKGLDALSRGKRQLSLGYLGKLKEHEDYDFEQYDLKPTHLAIVDRARGGDILSFEDKQKQKVHDMKVNFIDEDGKMSLQKVAETVAGLSEAIKNAPIDEVMKVMPDLEALMNSAKENAGMSKEGESAEMAEVEAIEGESVEDMEEKEVAVTDPGMHDGEEEKPMEDMEEEDKKDEEKSYADSQAFKDAVFAQAQSEAKELFKTVEKAKGFLDETYSFEDKGSFQIKKDAVEKEFGKSFEDSEVEGAFKALSPTNGKYRDFGDSKNDIWEQIKNTEM